MKIIRAYTPTPGTYIVQIRQATKKANVDAANDKFWEKIHKNFSTGDYETVGQDYYFDNKMITWTLRLTDHGYEKLKVMMSEPITLDWVETPQSSNIVRYRYHPDIGTLAVEFKGGAIYDYFDVSAFLVQDLNATESKGKFLNEHVKKNHKYARRL